MMKVIHIATAMSWRGGEQQVAYLFGELQKLGVEQMLICSSGSAMEKYCKKRGHNYRSVKKRNSFDPVYAYRIKKISDSFRPDLIHLHDAHAHTFSIIAAVVFGNKVPLVLSRRVDFPVSNNPLSKFKYNHKLIRKIVCVSDEIKRITGKSITDSSRLITIHSGIDLDRFTETVKIAGLREQFSIGKEVTLVGNTSAIADHKDYYTFINTAKILLQHSGNIMFFIIGDGPDREKILQYVKKRGIESHVIFTGFRNDVPSVLQELDIFLMTSKTEGLGTSILDAMASGLPVVSTTAGGIPEIIEDGVNGFLSAVGEPEGLAANVQKVISDRELRDYIIANALQRVRDFSKAATSAKTLEVYRELLTAPGLRNK